MLSAQLPSSRGNGLRMALRLPSGGGMPGRFRMSSSLARTESKGSDHPPRRCKRPSAWTRKYGDKHRFQRVTGFPAGIVPPERVRIYRRGGHHLLQWWDPDAKRNLAERIDGDLVNAIARARQVEERL